MESKIKFNNGSPFYLINGEEYERISYRSFWNNPKYFKDFYDKGITLFHLLPSGIMNTLNEPYSNCGEVWEGEGVYNFDRLTEYIEMLLSAAPDAKFALQIHLDTRDWYLEENPEAFNSFKYLALMCRDEKWRKSAEKYMCDLLDFMEKKYPERIFEIHLFAGNTCEWFSNYPENGLPESKEFKRSYEEWYADGSKLPSHEEREAVGIGVFRHPVKNKDAIKFWRFYSESIAETICYFAKSAKKHTGGRLPVGVFYGYTLCFFRSYLKGISALQTILSCPDVDIVFSPSAYRPFREADSPHAFHLPADSLRLHNKLYIQEIDNTTSITKNNPYADRLQYLHRRPNTFEETVNYLRKDTARVLAHGGAYWFFDMFGGWFDDPRLMENIKEVKNATHEIYKAGAESVSEIAVFIDAESGYYLANGKYSSSAFDTTDEDGAVNLHYDNVYMAQDALNRLGAPVSYYDSLDLLYSEFPHNNIKLYIFLNLFAPSQELKKKISELRKRGKSVLFLYAAGYITENGYSLKAMNELTGFEFMLAERETNGRAFLCGNTKNAWGGERGIAPVFTVKEDGCKVLARYEESNLPAAVLRRRENGIDAWCATGPLPIELIKEVASEAGVFFWHNGNDPVFINKHMFGLYSTEGGEKVINFPKNCIIKNLYDASESIKITDRCLKLSFRPKEFKLFLICD